MARFSYPPESSGSRPKISNTTASAVHGGCQPLVSLLCETCDRQAQATSAAQDLAGPRNGRCFDALRLAYERHGGIVSSDAVLQMLRQCCEQPISKLAHWLVAREIVFFSWADRTWVPMFQFVPADISRRTDVSEVLAELCGTFDDWEIATWFAVPNCWLNGTAPFDLMDSDLPSVLMAARADRYVAKG